MGADVEALYPNLADVDVALICYKAVMESGIKFNNINYKLTRTYSAWPGLQLTRMTTGSFLKWN